MKHSFRNQVARLSVASLLAVTFAAHADVVTDWNIKAGEVVTESKMGTPPAIRAMAIVQTAVHQAVSASTPSTSVNAAVAAANRVTLTKLMPAQQALIDAAYQAALLSVVDGPAKTAGIAVGEQAAAAVLAQRLETVQQVQSLTVRTRAQAFMYRRPRPRCPVAAAKAWLVSSAAQFRPVPHPH